MAVMYTRVTHSTFRTLALLQLPKLHCSHTFGLASAANAHKLKQNAAPDALSALRHPRTRHSLGSRASRSAGPSPTLVEP